MQYLLKCSVCRKMFDADQEEPESDALCPQCSAEFDPLGKAIAPQYSAEFEASGFGEPATRVNRKNPGLAVFLSFLLLGVGQICNWQLGKWLMFVVGVISVPVGIQATGFVLAGCIDAHDLLVGIAFLSAIWIVPPVAIGGLLWVAYNAHFQHDVSTAPFFLPAVSIWLMSLIDAYRAAERTQPSQSGKSGRRNPLAAVLLSIPFPGLGHFFNGGMAKAGLFVGLVILWFPQVVLCRGIAAGLGVDNKTIDARARLLFWAGIIVIRTFDIVSTWVSGIRMNAEGRRRLALAAAPQRTSTEPNDLAPSVEHERPRARRRRLIWASVMILLVAEIGLIGWASPGFVKMHHRAGRERCHEYLTRIGWAIEQYQREHGSPPPAYVTDEVGRPMHSWRVLILPYLGRGYEPLYRAYNFEEPWNGPNNIKLLDRMPVVFRCPVDKRAARGETSYLALVGATAVLHGATKLPEKESPNRRSSVLGGLRKTEARLSAVMVAEVTGSGVKWLEPRDLDETEFNYQVNQDSRKGVRSMHPGGANVLVARALLTLSCSARFLPDWADHERLRRFIDESDPFMRGNRFLDDY